MSPSRRFVTVSVAALTCVLACALGSGVLAAPTDDGNQGSYSTGTPACTTDRILVQLSTPLENKLPDETFSLTTGQPTLDAAILETGVHKIEYALRASMRDPKDNAAKTERR